MKSNLAYKLTDQALQEEPIGHIDLWDEDVELIPEEEWPTLDEPLDMDPDFDLTDDVAVEFEDCIMLPRDPAPVDPQAFVLDPLPLEAHRSAMQDEPVDQVQAAILMRFPGREVAQAFEQAVAILKVRHDIVAAETRDDEAGRSSLELLIRNEPPSDCSVLHREWRQALNLLQS
jgi:hypothetical protein